MVAVTFPEEYGYVLLSLIGIAFHCFTQALRIGRYNFMSLQFIKENLTDENKQYNELYGHDIPKGGYPDMGDGRHAAKLPYKEWLKFNAGQRAHQNYLEGLPIVMTFVAIAGLKYPLFTAVNSVVYILGREFFCSGYRANGANGRLRGIWFNIPLILLLGASVQASLSFTNLLD